MINSCYWPDLDEVAAFEELVGSHGGLGGQQSHAFLIHPGSLSWPADYVVGAERVHFILKGWLGELGQEPYQDFADGGVGKPASVESK